MVRVLKPPTPLLLAVGEQSVFLGGSIEMGKAEPWQALVESALVNFPIVILNPRRDSWDDSWVQSITNPEFRAQVEWELDAQERATLIAYYFAPGTHSPITLLELGLFARSQKIIVCCPPGYWRRGNVEVVCHRFGIPLLASQDELIASLQQWAGQTHPRT